jgi:hypothetical protein
VRRVDRPLVGESPVAAARPEVHLDGVAGRRRVAQQVAEACRLAQGLVAARRRDVDLALTVVAADRGDGPARQRQHRVVEAATAPRQLDALEIVADVDALARHLDAADVDQPLALDDREEERRARRHEPAARHVLAVEREHRAGFAQQGAAPLGGVRGRGDVGVRAGHAECVLARGGLVGRGCRQRPVVAPREEACSCVVRGSACMTDEQG